MLTVRRNPVASDGASWLSNSLSQLHQRSVDTFPSMAASVVAMAQLCNGTAPAVSIDVVEENCQPVTLTPDRISGSVNEANKGSISGSPRACLGLPPDYHLSNPD